MSIKTRLQRLEQATGSDTVYKVIDGFKYIGGKHGFLKVPVEVTESAWLAENNH